MTQYNIKFEKNSLSRKSDCKNLRARPNKFGTQKEGRCRDTSKERKPSNAKVVAPTPPSTGHRMRRMAKEEEFK
jgi:hypothetical protein